MTTSPFQDYQGARAVLARPVTPGWDHIDGPLDAPAVLVEYGDYECPFCGMAYPNVKAVQAEMGNRMAFVYRHFPLVEAHPHAEPAAESAEAAGAQGRFWAMHDQLFTHQRALSPPHLLEYAAAIGLDLDRFATELASRVYAPRVAEHFESGVTSGVAGTPPFFLTGVHLEGGYDAPSLLAAVQMAASAPH
jgi:protein-disulfide isomerase